MYVNVKDVISTIRHDVGRDLTEDDEVMINNAYYMGVSDGTYKLSCDIKDFVEKKQYKNLNKRKVYNYENKPIKYNYCEKCDREYPEEQCHYRYIGNDEICICESCLESYFRHKLVINFEDEDAQDVYYLTKEGKEQHIEEIKDQIKSLNYKIEVLEGEIKHNCKDGSEYQAFCENNNSYGYDND